MTETPIIERIENSPEIFQLKVLCNSKLLQKSHLCKNYIKKLFASLATDLQTLKTKSLTRAKMVGQKPYVSIRSQLEIQYPG